MPFAGIIWATIICVPLWLVVILAVKVGAIALETIVFVGLVLSALLLFLVLTLPGSIDRGQQNKQQLKQATRFRSKTIGKRQLQLINNGGGRSETDRRKFDCTNFVLEKRSGRDRRKRPDRRAAKM
jgi:hypothetical protein